ncbi:MAG: hypothetical protein RBR98_02855 [Candidatus Moranbacteria bacterium]|jgi:hypothetical protein|nr:hypothetical protein [Candidatus Moranbacteria bacterium]
MSNSMEGTNGMEREEGIEDGENVVVLERERINVELEKINEVKRILEKRYPSYGVLKSFIEHLASTEKVFVMAGIKKFGGDEIMDMFIDSEIEVMVDESGIEKDVFIKIKEEFIKTDRDVSEIKDVAEKLKAEHIKDAPRLVEFIDRLEECMINLLEISDKREKLGFDFEEERARAIDAIIKKFGEGDALEEDFLKKISEEFKRELKVGN